jgi:hypothetical protein
MNRFAANTVTATRFVDVPLRCGGGRPGPDRHRWVIRPDDLLVLAFDLVNLQVQPSTGEAPAQLVRKGPGQAYLIVWFPPQHIIEKAYFTTIEGYPVAIPSNPGQTPPLSDPDKNSNTETPEPPPIDAILSGCRGSSSMSRTTSCRSTGRSRACLRRCASSSSACRRTRCLRRNGRRSSVMSSSSR